MNVITPIERTRRFWTAHGRSTTHLTIIHAFCSNPTTEWTPEGLSLWYGVRIDRARKIVGELARCGIVKAVPGRNGYRWNGSQDWAVPRSPEEQGILRERWESEATHSRRAGTWA